ncbi:MULTISPECIES: M23 family metallopeptidase [Microbacterium]|uniref:M23 family metallopeptidase n=1 Tax=Microbacterium wangchenii TaxID=2541726 RepID=A0ABX5STG0_9MICO|nr:MULTISPECIES: M23 family metallopeptidase [Microbacterium]MCK6065661.1 M23 family metallopeptidase [Microbacterium sp. EYE_512]QBR89072.1 M23 family metallopeptidase [Microbacterium wangchenii]
MASLERDHHGERAGIDLAYPFRGRCLVQNSPADRVPSHGTQRFATAFAIDFVPVDGAGRSGAITGRTLVRPEPADVFVGFGRPVLAPVTGTVVAVHDGEDDHAAFRGLPSLWYALAQAGRVAAGWQALAGNHVLIAPRSGVVVAVCHVRRGSIRVAPGERVAVGDGVGECGNSGNSTEPHVHVQAMDGTDPSSAAAIPVTFGGRLPAGGTIVTGAPG